MTEMERSGDGEAERSDGAEPTWSGPPPSRGVIIAAGVLALVVCAFWLSCHETASIEPAEAPEDAYIGNGLR